MTPDLVAVLLSRIQFGFTVSFHIIFLAFIIGLAAWLAVLEGTDQFTGRQVYRTLFQFGSTWSELSRRSGPIQGPLPAHESFTAFALEASFFGVLIFGRSRVPRPPYLASAALVAAPAFRRSETW